MKVRPVWDRDPDGPPNQRGLFSPTNIAGFGARAVNLSTLLLMFAFFILPAAQSAPLAMVWSEVRSSPLFLSAAAAGWLSVLILLGGCWGMHARLRRADLREWFPGRYAANGGPRSRPPAPRSFLDMGFWTVVLTVGVWLIGALPVRVLAIRPAHWWEWPIAPAVVAALPLAGAVLSLLAGLVLHQCIGHLTKEDLDEGSGPAS